MKRTQWIESLKPKDKAIHVWHDVTMELITIIEIKAYCDEILVTVISVKQERLFAHWVNMDSLIEPTDDLLYEIELNKKTDRLEYCIWKNIGDTKINAVYDILYGDSK